MAQVVEPDLPDAGVPAGGLEAPLTLEGSSGEPLCGWAKTSSSSPVYSVRWDQRSSSPTSRSAIGTERRVDRSDLPSRRVLAAHECVADADALRGPVDVAPAQPQEL